jgi:asparagine synthase (glutamine-hydrolysing)
MTTALFGPEEPGYVSELMSDAAIDEQGLLDPKAARLLRDRARARDGVLAGEREEMGLVGALTLQALARAFLAEGPARAAEARARFDDGPPPQVLVDLTDADIGSGDGPRAGDVPSAHASAGHAR